AEATTVEIVGDAAVVAAEALEFVAQGGHLEGGAIAAAKQQGFERPVFNAEVVGLVAHAAGRHLVAVVATRNIERELAQHRQAKLGGGRVARAVAGTRRGAPTPDIRNLVAVVVDVLQQPGVRGAVPAYNGNQVPYVW